MHRPRCNHELAALSNDPPVCQWSNLPHLLHSGRIAAAICTNKTDHGFVMVFMLLQAQAGEKRSSDRRARDLEIRISGLAAARAQSDQAHDADLQVCDGRFLLSRMDVPRPVC